MAVAAIAAVADLAMPSSEIVKPRNDKREYRRIVLPNSLVALLISDPDTDKAAASMNVSVGYFADPEGLEGLAHFLEHMLFYASEKYPVENSYSKYITEHGGSTNAFTSLEQTNFFFDVNTDCFENALDRFAQFFTNPLLSPDATQREIKAVDSENQKNLQSDGWRMNQLQKHLSSRDHPYHKFGTGNCDTLEVKPKERGLDTRAELIKFYEENYSANLMHLVVYAKENLESIQRIVEEKFQNIRNTERDPLRYPGQPCLGDHLQVLVRAVPIKEGHTLKIVWPITPNIQHYKEGPCMYVSHLIGHEGEGSVFHALKKLGWALSLGAGEAEWSQEFSFFSVVIKLTDEGHEHVEDIVGLLFRYIGLLKRSGVPEWIFEELLAIRETGFHYRDKSAPIHYVMNVSSNMQLYPPEDWLMASSVPSVYNKNTIENLLDELRPENVRIFWESKKFEGLVDLSEPWYGTLYSVERISASTLKDWEDKAPNEYLDLPKKNPFIPTDLSLKNVQDKVNVPYLLRKTKYSRLWYKPDKMFFTPRAYVRLDFNCPRSIESPETSVLVNLYTELLIDYLNEYAYDAAVAGLHYSIEPSDTGFQVKIVGYNHKLGLLLDAIIGKIAKFEVDTDRFYVIKESVTKEYENFKFREPYMQVLYYCSLILEENTWSWDERFEALPYLQPDDLVKFIPEMLEKTFIECYIAGNIESSEAQSFVENIEKTLFDSAKPTCKPLLPSQHLTKRIVNLEEGSKYFYPVKCLNPKDENSALIHYIQVHQDDPNLNVLLELFALIAKQPAFDQLRSVEQLGYIVVLRKSNDYGVRGLQFLIQSTVMDPSNLDARVDAFLNMFESNLYKLADDEFKSNVNALIDMKLEKHKNLREESAFFWREIEEGTLKFDRKEAEVAVLREINKDQLIEFFDTYVKVGAPQKKTLSVQVYGALHSTQFDAFVQSAQPDEKSCLITDIFSFRRSRPLYGSFKGGVLQMKF